MNCIDRKVENHTDEKIAAFIVKQKQNYEFKIKYAEIRAWEFYNHPEIDGNAYVAVGGLDSITLYLFLHSIGIRVPGVSVSSLEDASVRRVHKALGIISLQSATNREGKPYTKASVIKEFGWPVLSKEIAGKISLLQNPSDNNKTVRHAIITGETGAYGGYRTGTRMRLAQKWLEKFGGYENLTEGTDYGVPDFRVSDKCCYYLKEKPCNDYAKESGRSPYMGLMASEGGRRQKALMINGCNYISEGTKRSCPFAIFTRQDLLRLALEMNEYYRRHHSEFSTAESINTIVPEIYGAIEPDENGNLQTTKAQRTGCAMCGFGIHLEKRPHRFDLLWQRNPVEWNAWMNHVVRREDGSWYGWGHVLDYIGVPWRNPEQYLMPKPQQCNMLDGGQEWMGRVDNANKNRT